MAGKTQVEKYLRYVKTHRKISKSTYKVYQGVLKEFSKYPLTPDGLDLYLEHISEQAHATQARKIVIIKNYLEWLYKRKQIKKRYWEDIRPPRGKKIPKWLTPSEVKKVIETAKEPYNYVLQFLYKTGMRIGELENLKEQDIQKEKGEYLITIHGKGNKERQLRVSKKIIDLLYKAGFPKLPSRRQIQKETQRISKILKRRVTPHMLRHSFAVNLIAQGKPITLIQSLLGHAKLDTTAVYTSIPSNSITLK